MPYRGLSGPLLLAGQRVKVYGQCYEWYEWEFAMNKGQKGSSLLSGAFKFLKSKPTRVKTHTARKAGAEMRVRQEKQPSYPYRAAEIVCEEFACDAVKNMAGNRFLLRDVPLIPIPDCTSPNCECSYIRYNDRRNWSEDRREHYSLVTNLYAINGNVERREKQGRRAGEESSVAAPASGYEFKNRGE